jgi:hypothetical protein
MKPSQIPLLAKALSKVEDKLPKKASIKPGEYVLHGRAVVDLDCVIKKGEAQNKPAPAYKIDWHSVLAQFFAFYTQLDCDQAAECTRKALAELGGPTCEAVKEYASHIGTVCDAFIEEHTDDPEPGGKDGATSVIGKVTIHDFKEAA